MRVNINQCGEHGIVRDIQSHLLPPNAWTGGKNVVMRSGSVHSRRGTEAILGTPQVAPDYLQYYQAPSANFWLYAGAGKIYSIDSALTHSDISGATYSTSGDWQGTFLNGVAVFNNGVDNPLQWGGSGNFATLSNWDTNNKCKVMRSFKEYLFALHVTESGTTTPTRIIWSDAADPGAVPASWDYTDATVLAGRVDLASEGGHILDMMSQQQYGLIYKETSVIRVQAIGGVNVFRFDPAFSDFGIMATGCVADVDGSHAVFTDKDLIIHNGSTPRSIVEDRVRRSVFSSIDRSARDTCFVAVNKPESEVWYCYPELGQSAPSLAVVYNYKSGAVGYRELESINTAALGDIAVTSDTWDAATETWDTALFRWNELQSPSGRSTLVIGSAANTLLTQPDRGYDDQGNAISSSIERIDMTFPDVPPGTPVTITRVYPGLTSLANRSVNIWVGGRDSLSDSVTWQGPFAFDSCGCPYIDPVVTFRWPAIRFEFNNVGQWQMGNIQFDLEPAGEV